MTEPTDKPLLDDEQQLDEYLKGDSSVSRQYRQLPSAEVPVSLDRLVLRQAEEAVKERSVRRPAWVRWAAPLAVAASAVLVVSIVLETGLRDETMLTESPVSAPAPAMQAKRERVEMPQEDAAQEIQQTTVPQAASRASAPPPAAPQAEEKKVQDEPMTVPRVEAQRARPAEAMTTPSPVVGLLPEAEMPPPSVAAAAAEATEQLAAAEAEREQRADHTDGSLDDIVVTGAKRQQQQPAGPRNTVGASNRSLERNYSQTVSAETSHAYSDPEEWLKVIRELRKENKQEEADKEWRRFREAFPDYEVAETDAAREAKK